MKTYNVGGYSGCVIQVKRNRITGRPVSLLHNQQAGLDDDNGASPWSTVCDDHGTCIAHATLALARAHLRDPTNWCEDCGEGAKP